jgi:ABC-type sugar transport system permease subunit
MWFLFYNSDIGMAQSILRTTCGWINTFAGWFGVGPIASPPEGGVLGDPAWAMIGIAVLCFWNGVGVNIILYLVGLQRIPDDLYEAALVDGAGARQRLWHVTLPMLRPTIYLVVLLSTIDAFKIFGQPYIMTGGGPSDATLTFVMRLYTLAFSYGKFQLGYAAALAYALAVFIFVMSLFLRRLSKPVEE